MVDPDFSAIGTDAPSGSAPSELAQKEDKLFALERAKEDHNHALELKKHELGAIGRVFGSRDNAITYVIAFLVVTSLIMIGVFSFADAKGAATATEFFKTVAFAGLGYLTGKSVEAK